MGRRRNRGVARHGSLLARIGLACALAALAAHAIAQTSDAAQDVLVERWTTADGLPVNGVNQLHVGRSGFLWLATFDGLVRFDGQNFSTFTSATHPGLPSNRLVQLAETPDAVLWMLSDTGQLVAFDGTRFRAYGRADGLPSDHLFSLQVDGDGTLWAYTHAGAARRGADGRFARFSDDSSLGLIGFVDRAPDGALWAASTTGLHRIDATGRVRSLEDAPRPTFYFTWDTQGRLWVPGETSLLRQVADGPLQRVGERGAIRAEQADGLVAILGRDFDLTVHDDASPQLRPRDASHPVNGRERLLARSPDGSQWRNRIDTIERNGEAVYTSPCTITDFEIDATAQVWVASACEGLARLRPRKIEAITRVAGNRLGSVYGLAEADDGALWIATLDQGVAVLAHDGSGRWLRAPGALADAGLKPLWIDADGVWVGGCRLDASQAACDTSVERPAALGRSDEIRAVHRARDGSLWFGGRTLWRRSAEGTWDTPPPDAGLGDDEASQVRVVAESVDGTLWFGTRGRGLLRRDVHGAFRVFALADGLASNAIRALRADRDGTLWIGTEDRGLCRMRAPVSASPQIACLGRERGLWSDSLHQLLFDDDDRVWINSNHGVFVLQRMALDAVLDGRAARVHPQVYTERDGLPVREGNGGVSNAGIRLRDGRIAFPSVGGVAVFDPHDLQPAATPARAHFESIELAGGERLPATDSVALPRGERSVLLRYTGLTDALSAPLYFRYRMLPDTTWIDLGEQRQLSLSRLPGGKHPLELQAFDSSGAAGPAARMVVAVPRYAHETMAFRVGLPLLLVLLAAFGWQRQRRSEILRRERLEHAVAQRTDALRHAFDTVSRQRNEIEALAAGKARFFANVSHELRTPLSLISGPLQDAGDAAPLTPQVRRVMRANAQRLERLVEQLLDLERIDAGQLPLQPLRADLSALVRDLVEAFEPLARRQDIALRLEGAQMPLEIAFDAEQMQRLLGNLLSNALKFTPSGGAIDVALRSDADEVRLCVSDTGPGVPVAWHERIFDRFAQVGAEATRSREGAGLGLAICREIASLHGGQLGVEDRPGGGARFVLVLPRLAPHAGVAPALPRSVPAFDATSEPATGPSDASAGSTSDLPRRRVLVAEDHPDLRAYIVSILQPAYDLIEACDGELALDLARQALPDVIVSDVMMPRRDGLALARALRAGADTAGIPLIFLTARAAPEDAVAGLGSGADQYLRKPFDATVLRAHVAAALHTVERLRRRFAAEVRAEPVEVAPAHDERGTATPVDQRFAAAVQAWIEAHLHDETASVQQMAASLHISRATLARRYQRASGETPIDGLRRLRLERARALLARGEGSVSEVAYAVGYASLAAFSNAYRERYGHAPSRRPEPDAVT